MAIAVAFSNTAQAPFSKASDSRCDLLGLRHQAASVFFSPQAPQRHPLISVKSSGLSSGPRKSRTCAASHQSEFGSKGLGTQEISESSQIQSDLTAQPEEATSDSGVGCGRVQRHVDLEVSISPSHQPLSNSADRERVVQKLEETFRHSPNAVAASSGSRLSERWRDYHGANNWQGLVEPLDAELRAEILKYGELAQATYDAFDFEEHSKYCGSCRYSRENLMEKVGLGEKGYAVTKYLYAMSDVHLPKWFRRSYLSDSWSRDSNWMGFVAVASDETEIARLGRRDIVIAWRGTVTYLEWLEDMDGILTPFHDCGRRRRSNRAGGEGSEEDIRVERGFRSIYTSKNRSTRYNKKSASEQVKDEVRRLVEKYKDEELSITITGHSLGSALALLSAFDIASHGLNQRNNQELVGCSRTEGVIQQSKEDNCATRIPVCVFSFAGPRVGNAKFKRKLQEELGVKVLRVVNANDVVPKVPGMVVNEGLRQVERLVGRPFVEELAWTYSHVGMELLLNNDHSPSLKPNGDLVACHNLEAYLHLLDSYHSASRPFISRSRDIALVNKSSNFLKEELLVPPYWLQVENKGLVKNAEGKWIQPEREPEDIPSPAHQQTIFV